MQKFLLEIGIEGILLGAATTLCGFYFFLKWMVRGTHQVSANNESYLQKKNAEVDLKKFKPMIYRFSLAFTLGLTYLIFELPNAMSSEIVCVLPSGIDDLFAGEKPFVLPPPPKPKPIKVEVKVVEAEPSEPETSMEDLLDEFIIDEPIDEIDEPIDEAPDEVVPDFYEFVEQSAEPNGGMSAFYKFMAREMKYPSKARRMGVQGKLYIQFIIDEEGNIIQPKVIRGLGGGCDEEAIRAMLKSAKWKPARQGGRRVKQRMVLPIQFSMPD